MVYFREHAFPSRRDPVTAELIFQDVRPIVDALATARVSPRIREAWQKGIAAWTVDLLLVAATADLDDLRRAPYFTAKRLVPLLPIVRAAVSASTLTIEDFGSALVERRGVDWAVPAAHLVLRILAFTAGAPSSKGVLASTRPDLVARMLRPTVPSSCNPIVSREPVALLDDEYRYMTHPSAPAMKAAPCTLEERRAQWVQLHTMWLAWWETLPDASVAAAEAWIKSSTATQSSIREGRPLPRETRALPAMLESAPPLPFDLYVYRGMGHEMMGLVEMPAFAVRDRGFLATALDFFRAFDAPVPSRRNPQRTAVMQILVPAGTRVLPLYIRNSGEAEILLPADVTLTRSGKVQVFVSEAWGRVGDKWVYPFVCGPCSPLKL
jgi:hypothetical protein